MGLYEDLYVGDLNQTGDRIIQLNNGRSFVELASDTKQKWYEQSYTQKYVLGTTLRHYDRVFKYAKAGAANLVAGNVLQSAAKMGATTTEQIEIATGTAGAVGDNFLYVTAGTTNQAANTFKDGYIILNKAGGSSSTIGYAYRIKSHGLLTQGTACKVYLYDPIVAVVDADAEVCVAANIYKGVIQSPVTTPTGSIVGIAPIAVTAAYYFWCQTWGPACVLNDAATVVGVGKEIVRSTATAGSAQPQVAGASSLAAEYIGYARSTPAVSEGFMAELKISL